MDMIQWREEIPVAGKYDVLVAGGGLAGAAAALSAARRGQRVLLTEKQCALGGLATTGLVNFWVPLCNGRGKMIIRGMAEEFLKLSIRDGFDTLPPAWKHGEPTAPTEDRCATLFSAGLFSLALLKLLRNAGVTIAYDTVVTDVLMDGGACRGVIAAGKNSKRFYETKMLVDATGDAELLKKAGVPTVDGRNYMTYYGEGVTLEGCKKALETGNLAHAYYHPFGGPSTLYGDGQTPEMPLYHGADVDEINRYLQENQLLMLEKELQKPRDARAIHMLPGMPQLRTSRRIDGDVTFTETLVYQHRADSIGAICDFDYRDRLYEVPYGTLVRSGFSNLITCGRSASASGWGWDVLRVIPPAVLTGQAAGIAAAMANETGAPIAQVPLAPLQKALADTGVLIHFDDAWVPEEKKDAHGASEGHI